MKHFTDVFLIVLGALLFSSLLTGCETVKGMGRDVQWTGQAVQDTFRR